MSELSELPKPEVKRCMWCDKEYDPEVSKKLGLEYPHYYCSEKCEFAHVVSYEPRMR